MKKIISIILILSLLFLSSCGKNDEDKTTTIKIGISVYDQYDTFIASMMDYLKEEALKLEEEKGITISITINYANRDQIKQNDQIKNYVEQNYDIILINMVDRTDATTVIDRVKNADIPVVFFNRELVAEDLERWDKLYYVGSDAIESGIMQGEIVSQYLDQNFEAVDKNSDGVIQYVVIEGEPGHQDTLLRTNHSITTIRENGYELEKLDNQTANWDRTQAESKMSQWFTTIYDDIELVICNNDDMALGAVDAMNGKNISDRPIVVGIDGTKSAIEAVNNKDFIGTVYNDSYNQGLYLLNMAYLLYMNEPLDGLEYLDGKCARIPHSIVTYDNVDEYLK